MLQLVETKDYWTKKDLYESQVMLVAVLRGYWVLGTGGFGKVN
jgi:hypothetical protein